MICGGRRSGFCQKHIWRLVCGKLSQKLYRLPTGGKQFFLKDLTEYRRARQHKNPSIRPGLDLRWPATNIRSTQELECKPGTPKDPTPKVNSHYDTFIHTAFNRCLVLSPSRGVYSFRAQDKAERVGPLDPGMSRGVCSRPVSFTRVYTPRNTRDRSITRSLQS